MSIVLQSSGGGQITINEPTTASNFTQTLPSATGTVMVSGNMPTFSAWQSSAQTLSTATTTKLQFQTEEWDTANCFDSTTNYRFTPNVAGYYQVTGELAPNSNCGMFLNVLKNGAEWKRWNSFPSVTTTTAVNGTCLVFLNGSTDYIELYGWLSVGQVLDARSFATYFQAVMVRGA